MSAARATVATGLDRLLARLAERPDLLAGRHWGLLAHGASVTAELVPAHLALAASPAGPPDRLFGPEHGYYGVEQDMVAAADRTDPWTGAPIVSLYGESADSLAPPPAAFDGLDVLVVDLQDVGSRYYTYAATAVWAARAALEAGAAVWVLDRPNPLGGEEVEGNLLEPGLESFVGAFRTPVRHGLTLAELVRLEAHRRPEGSGWPAAAGERVLDATTDDDPGDASIVYWPCAGWRRETTWEETGLPWVAPSPNMPTLEIARLYPGGCLIEATEVSEGRGTTRPFKLVGAPGVDPRRLAERLRAAPAFDGIGIVPTYFRPGFQKHAGASCGGVELVLLDPEGVAAYRAGVELLRALAEVAPEAFAWRAEPYEFVADRPAIDLLAGSSALREAIEAGREPADWLASWPADEAAFRAERREILLYPETR